MAADHLMLDLETLGVSNNARIVTIGACRFDPLGGEPSTLFNWMVEDRLGVMDAGTVAWWMKQSEAARKTVQAALSSDDPESKPLVVIEALCSLFSAFTDVDGVEYPQVQYLWSNGPTFDETILRGFFERYGQASRFPVSFRGSRCFRTAVNLAGLSYQEMVKPEIAHDALSDAIAQAKTVQLAYKRLGIAK